MLVAIFRRVLLFALLTGLSASLAAAGEARWVEVRSPNFLVYTDAGEKRGQEVALHFEQMRFVFGNLMQRAKIQTGFPVRVVAFRNSKGFRSISPLWKGKPKDLAGFYIGGQDVAFVGLDLSSEQGWATVFHEYAHLLLNSNVQSMPLWFDEGFAEFYSTTRIDKSEWVIGSLPEYAPALLANNDFIPLVDLFSAKHDSPLYNEDKRSMFYAESWLAVEYFWFNPERNKQLLQYFDLRGKDVPVADALKRAFGKDPAQLNKDFVQFFRSGQVQITRYKTPPALDALELKTTTLDDLDSRAAIEELRLQENDYAEKARKEMEKILAKRPAQAAALRGLGAALLRDGKYSEAAAYLERAVAMGSDDARVYFYWAAAVQQSGNANSSEVQARMEAALQKCIALDPAMADAYGLLGFLQVRSNPDGAIQSLRTAISLSPRNETNYLNLATVYLNRQKLDDATALLGPLSRSANPNTVAQAQSMLAIVDQMKHPSATRPVLSQPVHVPVIRDATAQEGADSEMKPFSGTLTKVQCPSSTQLIVTIKTAEGLLVLNGEPQKISFGGRPLYCGMRNARVQGFYLLKSLHLLALKIQ